MRIGSNPNKNKKLEPSEYSHQIVIPIYIPNQEGYFKDSLKILKICLKSLFNTIHQKTCITLVNNGSCQEVKKYLDNLYQEEKIHELIHSENIGKLNAILKGLVGNEIELVTIADSDVLFLTNWQQETLRIFKNVPKAGVIGVVPQFKMYEAHCGNVIFDNFFNKKLRFSAVKNPEGLKKFYESIGWDKTYNQDYLKFNLSLKISADLNVLIGSGHFVATYKRDVFKDIVSFIGYKLGGISETYLDKVPLKKGYWRLTTHDNYAYHMGNNFESWMEINTSIKENDEFAISNFPTSKYVTRHSYFLKNRIFVKFISMPFLYRLFLKWKGLPKHMINRY
tara:strand:+ start:5658 stop:6668 length:1011 start_codon:yes stop_codon:yes gene_type:complete